MSIHQRRAQYVMAVGTEFEANRARTYSRQETKITRAAMELLFSKVAAR